MSRYRSNSDDRLSYDSELYRSPEERLESRLEDYHYEGTKFLDLSNLGITNIPYLPNDLEELYCGNNKLKSLPPLPPTLKRLDCSGNKKLKQMPELPPALYILKCDYCSLEELPHLPNTLTEISVSNNKLKTLPPLPHSLLSIHMDCNELLTLPPLPPKLLIINCSNNKLKKLPTLPKNLKDIYCYKNDLEELPLTLPSSLEVLSANHNKFPDRDFKKESVKEYHERVCLFVSQKRIE
jgi:Leucine-rich repeat (LRR) protein